MSKVFIAFFAALLLFAGAFALLALGHDAAAQTIPAACLNAINDDTIDDTVVNDGCPIVGLLSENLVCRNAVDDDAADDGGTPTANDGCPQVGARADCDSNSDSDTVVNDGCPIVGSLPENDPQCANALNDDSPDDTLINDGCTKLGTYSEAMSVGGIAELPDVAGGSGSSAGTYAALAGGLAAAVLALGAGAWYARRRLS